MEILATQSADVCTEQPVRGLLEKRKELRNYLAWFIEESEHARILLDVFVGHKNDREADAINHGRAVLYTQSTDRLAQIQRMGGLLFAWHGTKAVQGGAA